jgi:hypothetical protein
MPKNIKYDLQLQLIYHKCLEKIILLHLTIIIMIDLSSYIMY